MIDLGTVELLSYRAHVRILKVDENEQPLENVLFQLNDIMQIMTDKEGIAQAHLLSPGTYTIKEIQGLEDYQALNRELRFRVVEEYPGKPNEILFKVSNKKIHFEQIPENPDKPVIILPSTGEGYQWTSLASIILLLGIYFTIRSKRNKKK